MSALLWFSALFSLAWALWLPAVIELRNAKHRRRITEPHHFEAGLALVALGFWLHTPWLVWVGLSMMLDDGGMHFCQLAFGVRSEVEGGPASPWHLVYRLARNAVYGALVWYGCGQLARELERRFGL